MIFHLTEGIFDENLELLDKVESKDLFDEWFVKCETVDRRQNLYFVNRFSGLTLVARRLKFDFPRDMDLIASTFRSCLFNVLKRNGISKDAIRTYIKSVEEYKYIKNEGLNVFGFNNICNFIGKKEHLFTEVFVEQDRLSDTINKIDIKFGSESHKPIWLHKKKLQEIYQIENIYTFDAYEVSVKCESSGSFTRTFTLPINLNFFQLHHVIDLSINSENAMIYEFVLPQPLQSEIGIKSIVQNLNNNTDLGLDSVYQDEITLYDVFRKEGRLIYMSDLLEGTLFDITVKKVKVKKPIKAPWITELSGEIEEKKSSLAIDKINKLYYMAYYG